MWLYPFQELFLGINAHINVILLCPAASNRRMLIGLRLPDRPKRPKKGRKKDKSGDKVALTSADYTNPAGKAKLMSYYFGNTHCIPSYRKRYKYIIHVMLFYVICDVCLFTLNYQSLFLNKYVHMFYITHHDNMSV